jgi:hypothetical protein
MTDAVRPSSTRPYRPPDDPRLAHLRSYEEEAEFWDTHDFETLEPLPAEELCEREELERVARGRKAGLTAQLTIRLDRESYDEIAAEARALGVGPTTLARMWLRERLRGR